MSLVGSLEDLGLGDILQIVSLSRKSGVLVLRCEAGEGHIVFREGLVHAAEVKGGPADLASRPEAASCPGPVERNEAARREIVEQAVAHMFEWRSGEFSFDVHDDSGRDPGLELAAGLSPQYLTMEATRRGDERRAGVAPRGDESLIFSGEGGEASDPREALVGAVLERADPWSEGELEREVPVREPAPAVVTRAACAQVVVVDPELPALEWLKATLADLFERVHIFQAAEGGIARIRQYLSRGGLPALLLSARAPMDPLSGIDTASDLLRRLRAQAPRMPLLLVAEDGAPLPRSARLADGVLVRPGVAALLDPRASGRVAAAARALRTHVAPFARARAAGVAAPAAAAPGRADILSGVLDLAAGSFSRAALFLVRGGQVEGLAQRGLPRAGGPDDEAIRELRIDADLAAWFRLVIESGQPRSAPPSDEGDRVLAALLGRTLAPEAWVAPILGGGDVVALLYADNLPEGRALPDPAPLAEALSVAGRALERAARERIAGA
jgi:hypothetical protein